MRIQITDYGVAQIQGTSEPLKIATARFGDGCDYVPAKDASGLTGNEVFSTQVSGAIVINANVVKYSIGVDYGDGPFLFGEIAYFDLSGGCVAVAVSDQLIAKRVQTNKETGNSIRVDAYLSMVGGNFDMWIESIGSDIEFRIPTLSSVDTLPAVNLSDPNGYIINPVSSEASAVFAYASEQGLWNFDCYQFNNVRTYKIVSATAKSINIDISEADQAARDTLVTRYLGEKIVEFSSGKLYSICRTAVSIVLQTTQATIGFQTPLAELPIAGDTILLFSRTDVSISDLLIPVASETTLGGIILGNGLIGSETGLTSVDFPVLSVNGMGGEVTLTASDISGLSKVATSGSYTDLANRPAAYVLPAATAEQLGGVKPQSDFNVATDGALTLSFTPIKTLNNQTPDENGNINFNPLDTLEGLISPKAMESNADFNTYTKTGLFYFSTNTNMTNGPVVSALQGFTLEVVPISSRADGCVQRFTCEYGQWLRVHYVNWSAWAQTGGGGSGAINIATYTTPGIVYVVQNAGITINGDGGISVSLGDGLSLNGFGQIVSAIPSFNGRTGPITLTTDDIREIIKPLYNVSGGVAGLSEGDDFTGARTSIRTLPDGALYIVGRWNASTNTGSHSFEDHTGETIMLKDGGLFAFSNAPDVTYKGSGMIFKVSVAGNTAIDGISSWTEGELIANINGDWEKLLRLSSYDLPTSQYAYLRTDSSGAVSWSSEIIASVVEITG